MTISGFETFGDNQFATPITLFPDLRNQEKYQLRYDLSHVAGSHALKFGVDFIHEPVLSGAFASTAEQFIKYPSNPDCYVNPPGADCGGITSPLPFYFTSPASQCNPEPDPSSGITCTYTPAGDGSFSQNVQRLALYAEDSWRVSHHFTVNYGLRYQTTFGLFEGSGRTQLENSAYITLQALQIPIVPSLPHDDRKQIAPRLGFVYSPGRSENTVLRAGFGLYYDDLAQNGWATAFQGINNTNATDRNLRSHRRPGHLRAHRRGLPAGRLPQPPAISSAHPTRRPMPFTLPEAYSTPSTTQWLASADYIARAGKSRLPRLPVFRRRQPVVSGNPRVGPGLRRRSGERCAQCQCFSIRQSLQLSTR